MPNLPTIPLEETYSAETLEYVGEVVEHIRTSSEEIPFGLKRVADERDWLYSEKFQNAASGQFKAATATLNGRKDFHSLASRTGDTVDQGYKPHCVAYSGSYVKNFHERKEHRRTYEFDADEWYARCKEIDP